MIGHGRWRPRHTHALPGMHELGRRPHLQEFALEGARRPSRPDAVALARYYVAALSPLVTRLEDLDLGLTLFENQADIAALDSVLAAVALNRRAEALVSADGMRFYVPVDILAADYSHLLHGRGVTLYAHTGENAQRLYQQPIPCRLREATFVLDGLMDHETELERYCQ